VINPFDIDETAIALANALDRSPADRAAASSELRGLASVRTISHWLADQMAPLG